MHRLAAVPGGYEGSESPEGVVFIEQTPAPIVILTAADTDIQVLAQVLPTLPEDFPAVRVVNLLQLQQQLTIDTYAETVLEQAQVILVRLLGGQAYWSYGLEVLTETVGRTGADLWVLPGDDQPDAGLIGFSTLPWKVLNTAWNYWIEGGVQNISHCLQWVANQRFKTHYQPAAPLCISRIGRFPMEGENTSLWTKAGYGEPLQPRIVGRAAILFYRAHYLSGNTQTIEALCRALRDKGVEPLPIYVQSLQDPDVQAALIEMLLAQEGVSEGVSEGVFEGGRFEGGRFEGGILRRSPQPRTQPSTHVILNTTSFSVAKLSSETLNLGLWQALNIPVIQAICSGGTVEQWRDNLRGLSPRDMAMNVALPEVDGRIMSRALSFKAVQTFATGIETDVVYYQPQADRVAFVAELALGWIHLQRTPRPNRKIALVLANYPNRDGRLANGVGLDTPASCIQILKAMQAQGYTLSEFPQDGEALIQGLTAGVTNDSEGDDWRPVSQSLSLADYQAYFEALPRTVQTKICDRWGPSEHYAPQGYFPIAGLCLDHIFIGIQPARGYDLDPSLNYHAPDLDPPHAYLAFYFWLRHLFEVQAVVHVGKHGNLEWLPGKSVALSQECYPEAIFGPMPHLYPFIVNDPGEGAQAKRRSQAVIIDHLTPPLTRAELYGPLQQLEALIDEYYDAQALNPSRLPLIRDRMADLIQREQLHLDLGFNTAPETLPNNAPSQEQPHAAEDELAQFLTQADGYLCELKEAQIRDGLHIFGQCPQGKQLRDLLLSLARSPGRGHTGLTRAIALDWALTLDPLVDEPGHPLATEDRARIQAQFQTAEPFGPLRTVGDAIECLEEWSTALITALIQDAPGPEQNVEQSLEGLNSPPPLENGSQCHGSIPLHPISVPGSHTADELNWIRDRLLPNLYKTSDEITNLLKGLDGQYVPSGASGAPTRGRPDVLPTGRNFYSVDIRALPTESAWDVGRKAAEAVIERYTQEEGEYPKTLGLSLWGTATMRTGGDDIAQALALLGVQPIWDGPSRRMIDFEILSLTLLGRPRVDVTLRISGFFRDAFANLIDFFDQAVQAVAQLDEPEDLNPLAARVKTETQIWTDTGLPLEQAQLRARFRIFGSKPGAYGAGLQGLIEAQNWESDRDLAQAYLNWSSYAYTGQAESHTATEAFAERLAHLEIVLHNQDNREHDLLDSDDYYQFQGGLTAAVRLIQGENPKTYFGDHSQPERPKVRPLSEEIARVYRSRVVNPKWIAGVMRHGYKGAFEMSATVDYLFAYDASAQCVEDHMYQGVAEAYVLDESVQAFVQAKNPWALRDMSERLLEAHQRGLWTQVEPSMLDQLRSIVHQAEAVIESMIG